MPVEAATAKEWVKNEPTGHFELIYSDDGQHVTKVICQLCEKHKDVLKQYRNYSDHFINGILMSTLLC